MFKKIQLYHDLQIKKEKSVTKINPLEVKVPVIELSNATVRVLFLCNAAVLMHPTFIWVLNVKFAAAQVKAKTAAGCGAL